MMSCIVHVDGSLVRDKVISRGIDGYVTLTSCPSVVQKIPKLLAELHTDGTIIYDQNNKFCVDTLDLEKEVYTRLRGVQGVAECIGSSDNGILLRFYPKGDLETYIQQHDEPDLSVKKQWILEIVQVVSRCHAKRVLVFDIALRNLLLADNLSIRLIDFANSSLLAEDADVISANEEGSTVRLDLLHLANVIYSIMTWQKFSMDVASEMEWPAIAQLPDETRFLYSDIVQKCWRRHYGCIRELQEDLDCCRAADETITQARQHPHPSAIISQSSSPGLQPSHASLVSKVMKSWVTMVVQAYNLTIGTMFPFLRA